MKNQATAIYPDVVLQSFFVTPMVFFYLLSIILMPFIIIALFLQVAVGAIQIGSSLYYALQRRSIWHRNYFLAAVVYLLFLLILHYGVFPSLTDGWQSISFGLFFNFIPLCMSVKYSLKSWNYHQTYVPN